MSENIRRLPDSELAVMQAVWTFEPPVARSQIETLLPGDMAMTTLLTLLSRLQEKGFLRIEKAGRRSLYIPLVAQKDYQAAQSRRRERAHEREDQADHTVWLDPFAGAVDILVNECRRETGDRAEIHDARDAEVEVAAFLGKDLTHRAEHDNCSENDR